ncbi:MAG TPA: patatin-like phospholipase family protein [Pyrinomonadaceae bacterium]|jgi:predicted acylesterase/phospholipase RssA|nr:patatin-like phospholipase family protein [Pyrinomonadaceae bacterium]
MARDLAITFAGGGNRAFYQLGLMNRWRERLLPRVAAMATCSAGAGVATLLLSGRETQAGEFWKERRRGITRNFEWRKLARGARPTPHEPIYRDTLLHAFSEDGLERIRAQPFPILILTTAFPKRMPAFAAVLVALSAYNIEKRFRKEMIHPTFGQRVGFKAAAFDARACETPEELTDLIIASSATPPFTSLGRFNNQRLLDGGIIDNAPAFLADEISEVRQNLVLLTRPYPSHVIGRQGSRLYLAPAQALPVHRWDYTRPELIDATIETGERDAELYEPLLTDFLSGK